LPNFPVNAAGETYGSAAGLPLAELPDLIEAYGTNGQVGYILKTDFERATGSNIGNPQQAVAWGQTSGVQTIPLYAVDGKTVIGSFTVVPTSVSSSASATTSTSVVA
jgi:hypothetical protein